jgi:hypothetical protein
MGADYLGLLAGYGAAMAAFWAVFLVLKPGFLRQESVVIERPWLELALLALSVAGVIGVGQLYVRGMLLPEEGEFFQSANQLLIFAPAILVLVLLGSFWRKNFLPLDGAAGGLLLGVGLALAAFTAFVTARHGIGAWPELGRQVASVGNISIVVQVLLEDVLIAALAARLVAATNWMVAIGVTAALFAAAHIPAMLAEGASINDLSSLLLDTGLGVLVIGAIIVSRSVWWFWPVHAVMDLTQFLKV